MKNITKSAMIAALATPLLLVAGASAASAAAPDDGCARGFELWDVEIEPYMVDNAIDAAGNNDGYVCARALGKGVLNTLPPGAPDISVVYQFTDNDLPAGPKG